MYKFITLEGFSLVGRFWSLMLILKVPCNALIDSFKTRGQKNAKCIFKMS